MNRILVALALVIGAASADAQTLIPNLNAAGAAADADLVPTSQGGGNATKQTLTALWTWIQGHLASPGAIGGTTPAAVSAAALSATGAVTFSNITVTLSGVTTGTQLFCLGLDASNHIVTKSGACGSGGGGGIATITDPSGNTQSSATTAALGQGLCTTNGSSGTAPVTPCAPDRTLVISGTLLATDMAGLANFNGSSLTATIPAISSTVFPTGATAAIADFNSSSLAISSAPTINGCPWSNTLYQGGFYLYTSNGTSLDCLGFPGFGALSGDLTATGAGVVTISSNAITTGKLAANAVTLAKQATNTANTLQGFDGSGNAADVAVSTGLALSGGVLTATGGGGSGGGTFNYSDNGVTLTANTYFVPIGGGGIPQTTEAAVDVAAPAAATVANLQVGISAAPGAGNSYVFTLRDGGVSQTLTCTISGASATSCSDTTHSVNIAKGDLIDWQIVSSGTIVTTPTVTIAAANGTSGVGITAVTGTAPIASSGGTTPAISCSTCAVLNVAQTFTAAQRGQPATITISTATFTPNFDTAQNQQITLVHASCPCTLANPSTTPVAGQSGMIAIAQSATGSDTIGTWGSQYSYVGGTAAITLSTSASAVDYLPYYVFDATHIVLGGIVKGPTH